MDNNKNPSALNTILTGTLAIITGSIIIAYLPAILPWLGLTICIIYIAYLIVKHKANKN